MSRQFGDVVAGEMAGGGSSASDGFDLLVALAARYGASPEDLISELSGKGTLAMIGRDLLGLQMLAAPKKLGRPADDERNWAVFIAIERARRGGATLDSAIADFIASIDAEDVDGKRHDSIKRQFNRLKKAWNGAELPIALADFFAPPPARQTGDKNRT